MKTSDFNTKISSAQLLENIGKQFGVRINLGKYNREQLEDIRNKLRTEMFQAEGSAGINELLGNEKYQKDKAMLELLNTRIKEMLGEQMKQLRDKMDQLTEAKKGAKGDGNLANNYPPYDKVTRGDVVAGATGKDQKGGKAKDGKPFQEAAKKMCPSCKKPTTLCKCKGQEAVDENVNLSESPKCDWLVKGEVDGKTKVITVSAKTEEEAKSSATRQRGFKVVSVRKKGESVVDETSKSVKKNVKEAHNPNSPDADQGRALRAHRETELRQKAAAGDERAAAQLARMAAKKQTDDQAYDDRMERESIDRPVKEAAKKAKEPFAVGMAAAKKNAGITKTPAKDLPKKVVSKGHEIGKSIKKSQKTESAFRRNVNIVNEGLVQLLREDEEEKAKAITAAADIVNDFTSWMQRVGQYQTKSMIELSDEIRHNFGQAEAEAFKQTVGPALSATLETLLSQREAISNAVAVLAGEQMATEPMGAEAPMSPEVGPTEPDLMNSAPEDEFAASDAAAGAGSTGREMRESKFARKLAESHSLMAKLSR